jgi:hypothetical protein
MEDVGIGILWPFGIYCVLLVHFMVTWHDVPARWLGRSFDIIHRLPLYGRRISLIVGLQPNWAYLW